MPNLKDQYDLTVIGGGPAGTAAAITAARAGAKVLLLERGRFPRHKVCGEFVSAESLGLLSTLLGPAHALLADDVRIAQARIFLDGRILSTRITPPAASIARFDLDEALWKSAIHSGVQAQEQTTVQQIMARQITVQQSADVGPFRITTSAGECATRAVINATGRWSNLNSAPNHASSEDDSLAREKWLGVKAHFAERSPSESVDLYFFDGGYCGVQPLAMGSADGAGSVNACAMVRAEVARTLPEVFSRHPALRERSRKWQPLSEPVSTSPLIFRDPQPLDGNTLRVGDAAGFVDPFVGDGISLALRGGALAAEALIPFFRQETTLEAAAASYSASYEQQLAPVFRNSSRIRQALLLPKALRAPALFVMQRIPALTQHLVNMTR
jgi:flavin-dependent dehydrogenase